MITARDHSSGLLFDRWSHIGPKRRKLLDTSWPGVFRNFLLHKLPVERIAARFTEYTGRPSKELYAMLGALILQQTQDLSDEEVQRAVAFDLGGTMRWTSPMIRMRASTSRSEPSGITGE